MNKKSVQLIIQGIAGGVLVGVLLLHFLDRPQLPHDSVVRIGKIVVPVTIADTAQAREQGLSGTASLPQHSGKLFVFNAPDQLGFWMKDMQYPIDIIWIAPDWRIVDISADADPESYPAVFYPRAPAQYVLEVNAGFAKANHIKIGQSVLFKK